MNIEQKSNRKIRNRSYNVIHLPRTYGNRKLRTINKHVVWRKGNTGPASVQKIEMEDTADALYEVVTMRTAEGGLAVWKNPVLIRPRTYQHADCLFGRNVNKNLNTGGSENNRAERILPNKSCADPRTPEEDTILMFETASSPLPNTCHVTVTNIARNTNPDVIERLAKGVGVVTYYVHDRLAGTADLGFSYPDEARRFYRKCHRKMIDLSIIRVTLT